MALIISNAKVFIPGTFHGCPPSILTVAWEKPVFVSAAESLGQSFSGGWLCLLLSECITTKEKEVNRDAKTHRERNAISQRICEDDITGKLLEGRFMKMSKGYEDE